MLFISNLEIDIANHNLQTYCYCLHTLVVISNKEIVCVLGNYNFQTRLFLLLYSCCHFKFGNRPCEPPFSNPPFQVVVNNRLKFLRKPEAPSIPTPGQAYGYEENEDGTLRKQDPPDKDASLGPAFYAPQPDAAAARAVKLYKGERLLKRNSRSLTASELPA